MLQMLFFRPAKSYTPRYSPVVLMAGVWVNLVTGCLQAMKFVCALVPTVGSHMVTIRQLFSYRGNHSTILSEYHIGNFRGYGARMDDR